MRSMLLKRALFAAAALGAGMVTGAASAQAAPAKPRLGETPRYVNPLNLPAVSVDGSPRGVSLGDPTVLKEGDLYYMFATGVTNSPSPQGGAWVSKDLVHWDWKPMDAKGAELPIAPHVVKFNGMFYMAGNGSPLYRSANILGPYEEVGPWLDQNGKPLDQLVGPNGQPHHAFDVNILVDDHNKPYLYMAYGQGYGVWGAALDPQHMNRLAGPPKDLFKFNPAHVWERAGNANERSYYTFIEGPWAFERNGVYYIEYSASGTEFQTYATGVYMSKSPLGPYKPNPGGPLLRQTHGINTGPGHGSTVKGPDGNWWQFYLTVLNTPGGGRRVGMDPIGFRKDGSMFIRSGAPSETPQWGPGAVANPARDGDSGSIPLTIGRSRNMTVSSQIPGRDAGYAIDDETNTWWTPAEGDAQPTLTLDLLVTPPYKPFTIDSARIMFRGIPIGFQRPGAKPLPGQPVPDRAAGPQGPRPEDAPFSGSKAFRYRIEASLDGEHYTTVVDKTANDVTRYTEFDDFKPTQARFVRLVITDWPRSSAQPLGVQEFTVFGKYVEAAAH